MNSSGKCQGLHDKQFHHALLPVVAGEVFAVVGLSWQGVFPFEDLGGFAGFCVDCPQVSVGLRAFQRSILTRIQQFSGTTFHPQGVLDHRGDWR